ncbi:thioesterase II family protein [Streptomyces tropicalis]|uniref:Alpha/beta fold hydrolase n=1 Tax=Streptomyces tropicalis TaxID=3034234 RepID=A0ABT6A857_9ACTN|nr:alpha/beta fold hydrolase [Streptomyces tropicalis]MDF3300840.1 alpha/beta fold hydrolase [Streptomyces tropicalis]
MSDRTTLVCLPFAGAGASFYRPWQRLAEPLGLDVLPLQLPGRERRIDEEPFRDAHTAAAALLTDLQAALGDAPRPHRVALFGHSLGAVLAHELARRLCATPDVRLLRLFASGSPHPAQPRTRRATGLDDDAFLQRVGEFAGYAHEALQDPEMRELILPTLRADVEMHESYVPADELPLPVPVTSLRGTADTLVTRGEAEAWARVTDAGFRHVELAGGHMYLTESAPELLRILAGDLNRTPEELCV